MSDEERQDRRAFFRSLGRCALAGVLTVGAGILVARPGGTCINRGVCRGCPAFAGCDLPEAVSLKEQTPPSPAERLTERDKLRDCERPALSPVVLAEGDE